MASAPKASLPLLYKNLVPLNSRDHANWRARTVDKAPWVAGQHAVPLTAEEFPLAQRDFPIVFSQGDKPVPLALMGLNEGVNTYFDAEGAPIGEPRYVPAYIRRFPFLLARLEQNSDTMSLCFDPNTTLLGPFDDGQPLFDDQQQPTEHTRQLLEFCERFEEAGMRTQAFMEELVKAELLMEGEVSIQRADQPERPFVYRGFRMVNQEKLREARGDQLRKWNESGLLPLLFAHLYSLDMMRVIFARQEQQGKGPTLQQQAPTPGFTIPQAAEPAANN
jgi:hypothetical protein